MMIISKSTFKSVLPILLTCIHVAVGVLSTDRTWKTNCFRDTESGRCEESWIKISSSYYQCDLVIELESPPKRIGYVNGNIITAIRSQTLVIHNETLQPMNAKIFIPPRDEFIDKKDNRYYAADGTTYMADSETKKEIEILTSGEYSVNQLAFDKETNQLLILSFSEQPEINERAGSLFIINTTTINLENDSVQAEKIFSSGNRITAMAVEGDTGILLLGMRTSKGGKLVRLTKHKGNPCSERSFDKATLVGIVKETQDKLEKYFEDISTKSINTDILLKTSANQSVRALEFENIKLKRDLLVANAKLDSFNAKLMSYNKNLKAIQMSATGGLQQGTGYGSIMSGGAQGSTSFALGGPPGETGYSGTGGGVGYGGAQEGIGHAGNPFNRKRGGAGFGSGGWGVPSYIDAPDGTLRNAGHMYSPFGGSGGHGVSAPYSPWGGSGNPFYNAWRCAGYSGPGNSGSWECTNYGDGTAYGPGYGGRPYDNQVGSGSYGSSLYSSQVGNKGYGGSAFGGVQEETGGIVGNPGGDAGERNTERITQADLSNDETVGTGYNLVSLVATTTSNPSQSLSNAESEAGPEKISSECVPIEIFNKLVNKTEEAERALQKLMRQLEELTLNVDSLFNDTILPVS